MISKPESQRLLAPESLVQTKHESFLGPRSPKRRDKRLPFWYDFGVRRQAIQVHQPLRLRDCLFVKRCDSCRERIDECIKLGVRQRTVDIAIQLRQVAVESSAPKSTPTLARDRSNAAISHGASSRDQAGPNLPLREDRLFPAGKTHVACQSEFAADAGCPPPYGCNGDHRRTAQSGKHVR